MRSTCNSPCIPNMFPVSYDRGQRNELQLQKTFALIMTEFSFTIRQYMETHVCHGIGHSYLISKQKITHK